MHKTVRKRLFEFTILTHSKKINSLITFVILNDIRDTYGLIVKFAIKLSIRCSKEKWKMFNASKSSTANHNDPNEHFFGRKFSKTVAHGF